MGGRELRCAGRIAAFAAFASGAGGLASADRPRWKLYAQEPLDDLGQMISWERERRGYPELAGDMRLTCAAEVHAREMASRGVCTTVGEHGETPGQRAEACGYPWQGGSLVLVCVTLTAETALNELLRYPEKRGSILDYSYRHIGVGFEGYYWAILLAR